MSLDIAAEQAALLAALQAAGRPGQAYDSNTSGSHPFFCVSAPDLRAIARGWLAAQRRSAEDRAAEVRAADPDHQGGVVAAALDERTARRGGGRLPRRQ